LEEALVSDLILHLVDLSNPEYEAQMKTTEKVLEELGAGEQEILIVYNKIDSLENETEILHARRRAPSAVFLSARTGVGLADLLEQLEETFTGKRSSCEYLIPLNRYDLVARLKSQGELVTEETTENGYLVRGAPRGDLHQLLEGLRVS
jgi:GTP-binding protein HflX